MGWVTQTLRKTELKRSHADYQKQLLDISREKRRMARQNHYEQTIARNQGLMDLDIAYQNFKIQSDAAMKDIDSAWTINADGSKTLDQQYYEGAQHGYNTLKQDYEQQKLRLQEEMDQEMARLEDEANEMETMLDQEQVQVEAQLEAISAEIEAVGEAISSQIQASTIKLS